MRKHKIKRMAAAVLAIVALAMALSSCSSRVDASAFVKSALEMQYLGQYDAYMKCMDITEDEAQELYQEGMEAEVSYLATILGIEELSDSSEEQLVELYKQICLHSSFEVGEAVLTDEEAKTYSVEVTIKPINLLTLAADDLIANFSNTTDTNDPAYTEAVVEILNRHLPDIANEDAKTVTVQVLTSDEGVFYLKEEDANEIVETMIDYSSLFSYE